MSAARLMLHGVRVGCRRLSQKASILTRSGFSKTSRSLSVVSQFREPPSSGSLSPAEANRKARLELAVAYRALNNYGLNEGTCNHLSLMTPAANGDGDVMLIIPEDKHWSKVTSSCLLGVDKKGAVVEGEGRVELSAATIHRGLHENNENAQCVMHLHPPYITALGVLKDPELKMCHQNSTRFYNQVAYDYKYHGLSYLIDEGRRLADVLGSKTTLMMCNHGAITVAKSVPMAFDLMYYLERACMTQMIAMATGKELSLVSDEFIKQNLENFNESEQQIYAENHFYALKEIMLEETPDVVQ